MALETAAGYENILFAVFDRDRDGDDSELYYLKDIFADDFYPDDLKYITRSKTSLRMAEASFIQSAWEHVPTPTFI